MNFKMLASVRQRLLDKETSRSLHDISTAQATRSVSHLNLLRISPEISPKILSIVTKFIFPVTLVEKQNFSYHKEWKIAWYDVSKSRKQCIFHDSLAANDLTKQTFGGSESLARKLCTQAIIEQYQFNS